MHEIVEIVLHVIYQICHVKNLNIFSGYSYFPLKGEEHLHPQWDVLHSERPPDSDIKGQETGAEGVLQGEDRTALQQHLHVKASIPLEHLNTENLCDRWPALEQMGDTLGLTCFGKKKSNLALLSTRKKENNTKCSVPSSKSSCALLCWAVHSFFLSLSSVHRSKPTSQTSLHKRLYGRFSINLTSG